MPNNHIHRILSNNVNFVAGEVTESVEGDISGEFSGKELLVTRQAEFLKSPYSTIELMIDESLRWVGGGGGRRQIGGAEDGDGERRASGKLGDDDGDGERRESGVVLILMAEEDMVERMKRREKMKKEAMGEVFLSFLVWIIF
ncbi:hypothetical protein BVRB_5g118670 [Beta vulgaris subsp. vulgaris]|nr:hypothetical protein BVRB_5g118670 [Beta vulgaris subsp. vulgaris]